MLKIPCFLLIVSLFVSAGRADTNFVSKFEAYWQSHHASNVMAFVEGELTTNHNAEVYFARGIVAAYLQAWGAGTTNFFRLASDRAQADARYTDDYRVVAIRAISQAIIGFEAIIEMAGQDGDSPSWNTNTHALIFSEFPQEIPFKTTVELLAMPSE